MDNPLASPVEAASSAAKALVQNGALFDPRSMQALEVARALTDDVLSLIERADAGGGDEGVAAARKLARRSVEAAGTLVSLRRGSGTVSVSGEGEATTANLVREILEMSQQLAASAVPHLSASAPALSESKATILAGQALQLAQGHLGSELLASGSTDPADFDTVRLLTAELSPEDLATSAVPALPPEELGEILVAEVEPEDLQDFVASETEPVELGELLAAEADPEVFGELLVAELEPEDLQDFLAVETEPAELVELLAAETEPQALGEFVASETEPQELEEILTAEMEPTEVGDFLATETPSEIGDLLAAEIEPTELSEIIAAETEPTVFLAVEIEPSAVRDLLADEIDAAEITTLLSRATAPSGIESLVSSAKELLSSGQGEPQEPETALSLRTAAAAIALSRQAVEVAQMRSA